MRIQIWPDPIVPGIDPRTKPHIWFAWRPVMLTKYFYDSRGKIFASRQQIVWLEHVQRKLVVDDVFGNYFSYRFNDQGLNDDTMF